MGTRGGYGRLLGKELRGGYDATEYELRKDDMIRGTDLVLDGA